MLVNKISSHLGKYLFISLSLFCCLWILLLLFYNESVPTGEIVGIQLISVILWIFAFYVGCKLNIRSILVLSFVFQILMSVWLYIFFTECTDSPFGYNPVDALLYRSVSEWTMNMSFSEFWEFLCSESSGLSRWSDRGYPLVQRFIFILAGNSDRGIFLMVLFNIIVHLYTTYILYRLAFLMLSSHEARLVALLWGINVCGVWINVSGLKEQIFVCLVINASYYFQCFLYQRKGWHLFLLTLFIALTWLFRYYISLFFILIFVGRFFFRTLYENFFGTFCIVAFLLVIFGLSLLTWFIPELYFIELMRQQLAEEGSLHSSLFGQIAGYILAFIGPPPSLLETIQKQNLLIVIYSCIKLFISIFGVWAMVRIIRKKDTDFYPMVNLVLLNTLLTITGGFALSYRFVYVTMPIYFILMIYGFRYYGNSKWLKYSYLVFSLLTIYFFNIRSL